MNIHSHVIITIILSTVCIHVIYACNYSAEEASTPVSTTTENPKANPPQPDEKAYKPHYSIYLLVNCVVCVCVRVCVCVMPVLCSLTNIL